MHKPAMRAFALQPEYGCVRAVEPVRDALENHDRHPEFPDQSRRGGAGRG